LLQARQSCNENLQSRCAEAVEEESSLWKKMEKYASTSI
jgi:hypothetical protein